MLVGRVGVVAVADHLQIAAVDSAAIAQDDLLDLLLVEQSGDSCIHVAGPPGRIERIDSTSRKGGWGVAQAVSAARSGARPATQLR